MKLRVTSNEGAETVRDVTLDRLEGGLTKAEHDKVLVHAVELGRLRRGILLQVRSILQPVTWSGSGRTAEAFVFGLIFGTMFVPVLSLSGHDAATALACGLALGLLIVRMVVNAVHSAVDRMIIKDDLRQLELLTKRSEEAFKEHDPHSRSTLSGEDMEVGDEVDHR